MEYATVVVSQRVVRGGAAPFAMFKGCAGFPSMKNKLSGTTARRVRHFITFSCYERRPLLVCVRPGNFFVKILPQVRERYRFRLVEYVLMNACPASDRGGGSRRSC